MPKIRIDLLAIVLVAILSLLGCKKPHPNPEKLDPIYSDLLKEAEAAKKQAETHKSELEKLEKEIPGFEPRDPGKKRAIQEKYKKEKIMAQAEQQALYYEVQAKLRLKYAHREYAKAFNADKPWPDPQEVAAYNENKKLRQASRNWEDRVPKMTRYNRGVASDGGEKKKEKPKH